MFTLSLQEQQNKDLNSLNNKIVIQNNELIQKQEDVKSLNFKNKEIEKNNKILSDSLSDSREELKFFELELKKKVTTKFTFY